MPFRSDPHAPRPITIAGFTQPLVGTGVVRPLTIGREVSVYYDQQSPNVCEEHVHEPFRLS